MNAEVPETHIATIAMLRQLRLDQSAGGIVKVDGCPNHSLHRCKGINAGILWN